MAKLTVKQREALIALASGEWRNAYSLRQSLGTLNALNRRKMVERKTGLGAHFFPRTAIEWRITAAGIAALESAR